MADYANLLATIAANIYTNNNNEVTAAMVKTTVDAMVASLGAGYQFMGIATPSTNPGTPDYKGFYLATQPGTYANFGGTLIAPGDLGVFIYGSSWTYKVLPVAFLLKDNKSGVADSTLILADSKVNLKAGYTYDIYYKTDTLISSINTRIGLWVYVGGTWTQLTFNNAAQLYAGVTYRYTPSADCQVQLRTTEVDIPWHLSVRQDTDAFPEEVYDTFANIPVKIGDVSGVSAVAIIIPTGVSLKAGNTYDIYFKTDSLVSSTSSRIGLWVTIGGTPTQIKQYTAAEIYNGMTYTYTPSDDCELWVRPDEIGITWHAVVTQLLNPFAQEVWRDIAELSKESAKAFWHGKNVVVWGDSITAQGNGDNPGTGSFMYWAKDALGFANLYGRGVGGQTYLWNTSGWYTEVGTNGNYLGRYNYDAQGAIQPTVVSPETSTAQDIANIEAALGKSIEIHYGSLCSWDRIKTMIPSDMRNDIDLVVLCGGTNDHSAVEEVPGGDVSLEEPVWVPSDATDPTWAGDATYYKGGDYDITTFSGAIASAIMKMRTWCPNAVIVLATPFPRFNTSTKQQYQNAAGVSFRQMCEMEMEIAGFVGAPVIDANGGSGIDGVNFSAYQVDGVHPNEAGRKMFGRVFVGELTAIADKIA